MFRPLLIILTLAIFVILQPLQSSLFSDDTDGDHLELWFDENTWLYDVGEVIAGEEIITIKYYVRIWGQAGRATQRLLMFCNSKFIGTYDVPDKPRLLKMEY